MLWGVNPHIFLDLMSENEVKRRKNRHNGESIEYEGDGGKEQLQ